MAKIRGLDIKVDWRPNSLGQVMAHVRIKRWYMPLFILKTLCQSTIPRRYWLLVYWQYYIERRWKHDR